MLCSTQRSDLIIISLSGMKKHNKLRQTQSRRTVSKTLQDLQSSWETLLESTEGSNTKDAHTKCWFNWLNRRSLIKKMYFRNYLLTASSFYSIFTQVPKTLNSTEALQEVSWSVLRRGSAQFFWIESVSVCSVSSFQTDWWWSDQISVWSTTSHWIITINGKIYVWKCKLIFPPEQCRGGNALQVMRVT